MINKEEFHRSVMNMAAEPKNPQVQNAYFKQVKHLAEIVVKSYRIQPLEDSVQDLIEYSIKKRLHERISPDRSAFSYYWHSLSGQAWWMNKERKKKELFYISDSYTLDFLAQLQENTADKITYSTVEGESEMFKRMGFNLDDYQSSDVFEEIMDNMETVEVTKGKRGRPKIKADGEKAQHWEYIFSVLKHKKTMTETALFKQLPLDKQKTLKNPSKSIEYYMRTIARREGVSLSVSNNGTDTVFMVVSI